MLICPARRGATDEHMWWLRPHAPATMLRMAIFKPNDGVNPRKAANGITYTVGAGGNNVMNQSTTNRALARTGRPSSAVNGGANFKNLDQTILNLDALYDDLPNQADWEAAAVTFRGFWNLCANCAPDLAGKKLFRQYNYWRRQLGLPDTTVAPTTPQTLTLAGFAIWYYDVSTGDEHVLIQNFAERIGFYVCPQIGQGMMNPIGSIDLSTVNVSLTSGPVFDMVKQAAFEIAAGSWSPPFQAFNCLWCQFMPDGLPLATQECSIGVWSL